MKIFQLFGTGGLVIIGLISACSNEPKEITIEAAAAKFCECKELIPEDDAYSKSFAECNEEFHKYYEKFVIDEVASRKIDSIVRITCPYE